MSDDMIERVADQICSRMPGTCYALGGPRSECVCWSTARAAIEAMREPTDAMADAGEASDSLYWSPEPGEGLDGVDYYQIWRAMIDAALARSS